MPREWGFSSFYKPGGRGFELSFCPGGGEFAQQKNCQEVLPWGGGGGGGVVMRLYERFSRNCQKSMFVLAYGHLLLDGTPFM